MYPAAAAAIPQIKVDTSSNGFKYFLITGGVVATYFFVVRPIVKKYQAENALKRDQQSTIKPAKGKVLKDLLGRPTTGANLALIAADIHDALDRFFPDQDRAVRVFFNTPWGYVPQLEKLFLEKYNKDLKQLMVDKLNDQNFIKVKFYFR